MKQMTKFINQIVKAIEALFAKFGFEALPKSLKVGLFASLFILPIIMMVYVLCFMKDGNEVVEEKKETKPSSRSKREKIE